jgi:integrase-like protein
MMLHTLLETAIASGQLSGTRVGPLKTAVKQYAAMLGGDAAQIPPDTYHLRKPALWKFIDQHAPAHLGPRALANLKDNLRWLLALGVREQWIHPPAGPLIPWESQRHLAGGHLRRIDVDGIQVNRQPYALLLPRDLTKQHAPSHEAQIQRRRTGLHIILDALKAEVEAYLTWCTKPYAIDRPASIKKRPISAASVMDTIRQIGGYAAHIAGEPVERLTLARLVDPALVQQFIAWWVNERRERMTATIPRRLSGLVPIAKYWLKNPDHTKGLEEIQRSIGRAIPAVWNKEALLIPLRELERIGLSCYPLNEDRLQRSYYARAIAKHLQDPAYSLHGHSTSLFRAAMAAQMSLLIRLMVRIPLRQRNLREMRIDHQLRRRPDQRWEIYFRGEELKVSRRQGQVNEVHFAFPQDIQWLLDEYLTFWRPKILRSAPDTRYLLLGRYAQPLTRDHFTLRFKEAIYRFSGAYVTPHLVRDIWASEYLDETGDITGAADRLGDTPQMVMQRYAHILKRKAQQRTETWLANQLTKAISP